MLWPYENINHLKSQLPIWKARIHDTSHNIKFKSGISYVGAIIKKFKIQWVFSNYVAGRVYIIMVLIEADVDSYSDLAHNNNTET